MLVDDIRQALPELRLEAEGRMVDACTITAPDGEPVFDDDTGTYTNPTGTVIYAGKCEVQVTDGLNARQTEAGGSDVSITRLIVKVPIDATGILVNQIVTITRATFDSELVDQKFQIAASHAKSFATCRRLQVERIDT